MKIKNNFFKLKYLIIIMIVIFNIGCTNNNSEIEYDLDLRTDILYSHTVLMKNLFYEESKKLVAYEFLSEAENLSMEEKIYTLEKVYGKSVDGSIDLKISFLEQEMVVIMDNLYFS